MSTASGVIRRLGRALTIKPAHPCNFRREFSTDGAQAKTVMITGVTRGLGRALALEMARRGHTVIGCARSKDEILALQEKIADHHSGDNPKHLLTDVDVSSDNGIQGFAKLVVGMNLVPDIIVNNAGTINKCNKVWEVPAKEFDMVMDTNIKGVSNVLRHFLPLMIEKKQGVIVNMSSGWGRSAAAQAAPYCASKWAVEGLSKALAIELPPGLATIALNPGDVKTDTLTTFYGSSADGFHAPEAWAETAADMILEFNGKDNGKSYDVEPLSKHPHL